MVFRGSEKHHNAADGTFYDANNYNLMIIFHQIGPSFASILKITIAQI